MATNCTAPPSARSSRERQMLCHVCFTVTVSFEIQQAVGIASCSTMADMCSAQRARKIRTFACRMYKTYHNTRFAEDRRWSRFLRLRYTLWLWDGSSTTLDPKPWPRGLAVRGFCHLCDSRQLVCLLLRAAGSQ